MYSNLVRKYEAFKKEHETQQETLKKMIKDEIDVVTKSYLQLHNRKVAEIHARQQIIESKNKQIAGLYASMNQKVDDWIELYNALNQSLKCAGDLVNYSQFIEKQAKKCLGKDNNNDCSPTKIEEN